MNLNWKRPLSYAVLPLLAFLAFVGFPAVRAAHCKEARSGTVGAGGARYREAPLMDQFLARAARPFVRRIRLARLVNRTVDCKAREHPGKQANFERTVAKGEFVVHHCHQVWPTDAHEDRAGIDIFCFDEAGKLVEQRDVLPVVPPMSRTITACSSPPHSA